ncbi:hypothetical protein BWQ96_01033 [Gracilariopsis chorda]|uniref:Uncharacterized protein n=1 Tax=Gracilariopsis chorda TaxID=448386 RepID=A0A2V3J4D6_9FLOR|nr:hypothetical protein BWQ96_01033 [Gracilariopsis chorda]|eukprot:PXF49244.1 hypothetical protein BWQ96_01033 [Gracilariopsis chorda]
MGTVGLKLIAVGKWMKGVLSDVIAVACSSGMQTN